MGNIDRRPKARLLTLDGNRGYFPRFSSDEQGLVLVSIVNLVAHALLQNHPFLFPLTCRRGSYSRMEASDRPPPSGNRIRGIAQPGGLEAPRAQPAQRGRFLTWAIRDWALRGDRKKSRIGFAFSLFSAFFALFSEPRVNALLCPVSWASNTRASAGADAGVTEPSPAPQSPSSPCPVGLVQVRLSESSDPAISTIDCPMQPENQRHRTRSSIHPTRLPRFHRYPEVWLRRRTGEVNVIHSRC